MCTSKHHKVAFGSLVLLIVCTAAVAQPAKENVLYSFGTNGGMSDGSNPNGGLVFDGSGNIYGTTASGGTNCTGTALRCGTLFELSPLLGGGWSETVLYNFCQSGYPNCTDGALPQSGLLMDTSGNLYGTTTQGGTGPCFRSNGVNGCGTVFEFAHSDNGWTYSVLYSFVGSGTGDGFSPAYATLALDAFGNLYGTTAGGGTKGEGIVYQLAPPSAPGGAWTETVLHSFCEDSCSDGASPWGGVAVDSAGNIYGTTQDGAIQGLWGVLYELSPNLDGSWTETALYKFSSQHGGMSESGVSIDAAGNLYGTLSYGGLKDCGRPYPYCGGAFKYTPSTGQEVSFLFDGKDGGNPIAGLLLNGDAAYGTTDYGSVFRIRGRTETVLYTFCAQPDCADGGTPSPGALAQSSGRLYGATSNGGRYNGGVVFEIIP